MSKRILVIEDSADFRNLLRMTLEFGGYEVALTANGREALEAARKFGFDLIISDIDMPEMNGIEFVRKFRADFGPATPIVIMSGEEAETRQQAVAAGATSSIRKPFEPLQLLDLIPKFLE